MSTRFEIIFNQTFLAELPILPLKIKNDEQIQENESIFQILDQSVFSSEKEKQFMFLQGFTLLNPNRLPISCIG